MSYGVKSCRAYILSFQGGARRAFVIRAKPFICEGLRWFLGRVNDMRNVCSHIKASMRASAPLCCSYCVNQPIFVVRAILIFRVVLGLRLRVIGDDIP